MTPPEVTLLQLGMSNYECPCQEIAKAAELLDELVAKLEIEVPKMNTAELWDALKFLRDAARYTHSSAVWLYRNDEKYGI